MKVKTAVLYEERVRSNDYRAYRSNPVINLDPLGLYSVNFGQGFTAAQQQRIRASIERVRIRANTLMKEIDAEIAKEKCQPLLDKLRLLRGFIAGMRTDLLPDVPGGRSGGLRGDDLDITTGAFNPDAPLRWHRGIGTDIEFNSAAKKPWTGLGDQELDQLMFHELTHEQRTDDGLPGESGDPWQDAHKLEALMHRPLSRWLYLKAERLSNKCPCNAPPASAPVPQPS